MRAHQNKTQFGGGLIPLSRGGFPPREDEERRGGSAATPIAVRKRGFPLAAGMLIVL